VLNKTFVQLNIYPKNWNKVLKYATEQIISFVKIKSQNHREKNENS
jgi:hypothetical protein